MIKLRSSMRWLAGLVLAGIAVIALAAGSAADILKTINDYRASLVKEAQDKAKADGSRVNFASIAAQVRTKAQEAIKDVDPSKLDAAEGVEWAEIFNAAGKSAEAQKMLKGYIATNPEPTKKFNAQSRLLSTSLQAEDLKTIAETLPVMQPQDAQSKLAYATLVTIYGPQAGSLIGAEKLIGMMDKAIAAVPVEGLSEAEKKRFESIKGQALSTKIDIYQEAGQKDKALALIDEAIKTADANTAKRLNLTRTQLTIVGSKATPLKIERTYGDFPGLEASKGKVVVLDFFAHWCGPCKRAFPDMRKMLTELKPKGLEIYGVTTYYGWINDQSVKLTPDEEYAKMADFVKEQNMTWPVLFGARENFDAYGVTAIPHVIVIGRDGVVHKLEVGYSPEGFVKFRKEIETLLAQK